MLLPSLFLLVVIVTVKTLYIPNDQYSHKSWQVTGIMTTLPLKLIQFQYFTRLHPTEIKIQLIKAEGKMESTFKQFLSESLEESLFCDIDRWTDLWTG